MKPKRIPNTSEVLISLLRCRVSFLPPSSSSISASINYSTFHRRVERGDEHLKWKMNDGVREGTSGRPLIKWRPSSAGLPSLSWWMMRVRSCLEILHQMLERCSPGDGDHPPVEASSAIKLSNGKITFTHIIVNNWILRLDKFLLNLIFY